MSLERRLGPWGSTTQVSSDAIQYLRKALSFLENKITCLGIGLQEFFCVSAILGLESKSLFPGNGHNGECTAADRVLQVIQKVLSLQDNLSAAATLASLPHMVSTLLESKMFSDHAQQAVVAPVGFNEVQNGQTDGIPTAPSDDPLIQVSQCAFSWLRFTGLILVKDFAADLEGMDLPEFLGWDFDAFLPSF